MSLIKTFFLENILVEQKEDETKTSIFNYKQAKH